jgi:hypothetical protein
MLPEVDCLQSNSRNRKDGRLTWNPTLRHRFKIIEQTPSCARRRWSACLSNLLRLLIRQLSRFFARGHKMRTAR